MPGEERVHPFTASHIRAHAQHTCVQAKLTINSNSGDIKLALPTESSLETGHRFDGGEGTACDFRVVNLHSEEKMEGRREEKRGRGRGRESTSQDYWSVKQGCRPPDGDLARHSRAQPNLASH